MTKDLKPKINNPEPHHSELKNLLELYQNRQYDDAEKLALTLTDKFKNHPFGWKVLGALLNQAGRLSEGLAVCQKSVSLEPNNAEAHNNLGNTLHKLDRFDEADENYRKAIALKSDYAEAHNNLGNTLHKLDRFDEAEESYRKAIAFKSGYSEAYFNLGNILQELGRLEEAGGANRHEIFLNSVHVKETEPKKTTLHSLFESPSSVEYANLYRKGMGTENVGGFLRSMALMLRPKRILEIGAGYTTPFLLEALVNGERIFDDGNLKESYFENYTYDPKLVVIDDMSLGELSDKPGMKDIISSKYVDFIHGKFEEKAGILFEKYGNFDFVWFDCGGPQEYKTFIDQYWNICSGYIFFHFTYTDGSPNAFHKVILDNVKGKPVIFDIVEPHKKRQGSITMVNKNSYI